MEQTTQPTPSPQPKKRRISKKQRRIMKIKAVLTLLFLLALFIGILLMIYSIFSQINLVKDVTLDSTEYVQLEGLPTQEEAEQELFFRVCKFKSLHSLLDLLPQSLFLKSFNVS